MNRVLGCGFFLVVVVGVVVCDYEVCNVDQMGGVGDGINDNTALFRKLFSECDEVIIPPGIFLTHPLNITRNHFVLSLEGTLKFYDIANLTDWPIMPHIPSYPCDRDICSCCRYQPLLLVWKAKNVTIQGHGDIDGSGSLWWEAFQNQTLTYGRPRLLQTMYASRVKILDIKMENSPFWTCHLFSSERIFIEGVQVFAPKTSPNTDGFDPDSSQYVHIKNSVVQNGDDCVAIKSGMDEAGLAYNKSSAHIFISDVKCLGGHGFSIGSEMSGGVEDVIISNSQTSDELRIKTAPSRGGFVRDVTYLNIDVDASSSNTAGILRVQTNYSSSSPAPTPPIIDNIRYEGITGKGKIAGKFFCSKETPCTNFVLVDIDIDALEGFDCTRHVTTASMYDVHPEFCPHKLVE